MRPYAIPSVIVVIMAALQSSGCNTERMWENGRTSQAPVVNARTTNELADVPDLRIAGAKEVDLVEQVLYHRAIYMKSLAGLRDYYRDRGYNTKRQWADQELAEANRIRPYKYILDAEIPATSLKPMHAIAEADEMYQRGLDLMKKGGHGLPVVYRKDLMHEALNVFVELITKYPSSDKIDDAAFCCGEIHKEYYENHEPIAVEWYKRAYTWDPNTPHPARFQAAVVYDFRMHNRARALELYHAVVDDETQNKSNAAFASRRIHELTEGMEQLHEPRPPMDGGRVTDMPPDMFGSDGSPPQNPQPSDTQRQVGSADKQVAADELVPVVNLGPDDQQP